MNDNNVKIEQAIGCGTENTIIGQYYNGMNPEQVTQLVMKIFLNNFPRLQEIAGNTARKRVEELTKEFLKKLSQENIRDFSPFADPDVQFMLWETHRDYARLGNTDLLNVLSTLIANRVQYDKDYYFKTVIDRASQVVNYLTVQHLDYLSILFLIRHVRLDSVKSIEDLEKELNYISDIFTPVKNDSTSLLTSLGCL